MKQAPFNKAKKDKFILVLTIPTGIQKITAPLDNRSNNKLTPTTLEFSVYGKITPKIKSPSITLPYGGHSAKIASHSKEPVDSVTFKFVIDDQWNNYWVIYKWLDVISDVKTAKFDIDGIHTGTNSQFLKDYSSTISVIGASVYEANKIQWNYVGAFPTELGEIDWNYRDEDDIECSATFEFTRLEAELL